MAHWDRLAVYAGLFAGLCFGIFWVPIRMVESAGIDAPWAMAVFTAVPAIMCLPMMWARRLEYARGGTALIGGILAGVAFALYAASLLYTDVVRAVLLFYLMPIWGFMLGWAILGDRILWYRWLAIGLGLVGMAVIFAGETGIPWPRNIGDWCGLGSGIFWAVGSLMILIDRRVSAATHTVNFLLVGALLSAAAAWVAGAQGLAVVPDWDVVREVLVWMVPVSLVLILPAGFATVFTPSRLNPGVAGFLFMTEIAVAAVSAAIWAGEPIGVREMIGLPLILSAGLVEPAMTTWRMRRARLLA